jgi:arabinogalactan oligomer/maltooligosaccharide transport system permease protein
MTSFFTGKVSFAIKLILVLLLSSVLVTLTQSAFAQGEYLIAAFLAATIFLLVLTYLTKISIPLKFFLPGILLLFAFVLSPILFTVTMSGYNYKTGNIVDKGEAIEQIQNRGFESDADGTSFDIKIGRYEMQEAILISDTIKGAYFISTEN